MQDRQQSENDAQQKDRGQSSNIGIFYPFHAQQWFQRSGNDLTILSLGEYFLPFFLAAMETCWLNAILIGLAGLDFLGSSAALLPFWGPPLLLFVALWLFRRALQKETATREEQAEDEGNKGVHTIPGLRLMFTVLALLAAGLIWLHIYSAKYFLLDPAWLLAFVGDLLTLNSNFYQALAIVAVTIYLCWRGMKLAQFAIQPGPIFRQLWVGLLILLAAILLRAGVGAGGHTDDVILVLLIPIFLYLALVTHALARITFTRRVHPFGLEGSIAAQERAMLSIITGMGLALLILTILGTAVFSPAFFTSLQPAWLFLGNIYDWLAGVVAQILTWIVTPIFYLLSPLLTRFRPSLPTPSNPSQNRRGVHPPQISSVSPGVINAAHILLILLILLILGMLVWLTLRRRKRLRIVLNLKGGDIHESVWSWKLFWNQLRALFRAFFGRFFRKRSGDEQRGQMVEEEIVAAPAARTIREIYRALLKKAAARGHMRRRDETPREFRQRLDMHEPSAEPQLGLLTDAYILTRYGGAVPDKHELTTVSRLWNELEQKWE
jgi:hypothetical protein